MLFSNLNPVIITGEMANMPGENLSFDELRNEVAKYLKTALNVEEFRITLAVLEGDVWRLNVSWSEKIGDIEWPKWAGMKVDANTGALLEFRDSYSYSH
jgi:hypothetical protein